MSDPPRDRSAELAEKRARVEALQEQLRAAREASRTARERAESLRTELDTLRLRRRNVNFESVALMLQFDLPAGLRLPRPIGVIDHVLYVYISDKRSFDVWSVNLYIPNSWKQRWRFEFQEVDYLSATVLGADIFFLFTGCYKERPEKGCLDILQLSAEQDTYTVYKSTDSTNLYELVALYDIHLETDTLCSGERDLFVYDRGLVGGEIPFTRFTLDPVNKTYRGVKEPIPDDTSFQPTTFGSLIDADTKRFVKLTRDNSLRVFNDISREWVDFVQHPEGSDLYLSDISIRHAGIGVTYNQEHMRYAIVSSPITLVAGERNCILIYKSAGKFLFYRALFDEEARTFKLRKVGRTSGINQGYMFCDRNKLIVLSRHCYYVPLEVLTLKELSFRSAQKLVDNPVDDSEIRKLCGVAHNRWSLI